MFDYAALESAGFRKMYSDEEWADVQNELAMRPSTNGLRVDYYLERNGVQVRVEQNTRAQMVMGTQTTISYPEIATVEGPRGTVTCPADDTAMILAMVDQVAEEVGP